MGSRRDWTRRTWAAAAVLTLVVCPVGAQSARDWAADVVIHRDEWGVPHIRATTDAGVAFGSAWAQCEDHFFQLEDTYIKALGRYSEVVGESGYRSDLEVALFDLVESPRPDPVLFEKPSCAR